MICGRFAVSGNAERAPLTLGLIGFETALFCCLGGKREQMCSPQPGRDSQSRCGYF